MWIYFLIPILFLSGCDFNILGGSKSKLSEGYNPGLRTESNAPTISPFADLEIDELDEVIIPFTITDIDTFLFCSGINLAVRSNRDSILSPNDISFTGTYPNCNLRINSRVVSQTELVRLTVQVTDFWSTASSSFNVRIRRVERPGPFQITSSEGLWRSLLVHWSNAAYMEGSSSRYTVYYKLIDNQTLSDQLFSGVLPTYTPSPPASQTTFTEVTNQRSPSWISAPANELLPAKIYEVYVTAKNSFNTKNPTVPPTESNHVFIRTLDQYRIKVREFATSSRQDYVLPGAVHDGNCGTFFPQGSEGCSNTTDYMTQSSMSSGNFQRVEAPTGSGRYRVQLNAQGVMFGE